MAIDTTSHEKSSDIKGKAQGKVSEVADTAKDETIDRLSRQKTNASGALDDVSDALHETSRSFRDHERDAFARYADSAADQVDQLNAAIRDRTVGEMLDEAQRFARRDPALFLGGAFLVGVLGARFLKASSPEERGKHNGRTSEGGTATVRRPKPSSIGSGMGNTRTADTVSRTTG